MAGAWQNTADAYDRSFARLCGGTVVEVVTRLGPGDGPRTVLDIGTGPGTVAAAARAGGRTVVGMDEDHSMTTLAARRHPDIAFVRAALPRLPCPDGVFDAVTANFVLNHTPDPGAATAEVLRTLRPGGLLVATVWTSQVVPLNQLWKDVVHRASVAPPPGTRLPPALDFDRTVAGFSGLLAGAGFDQVDCRETRWTFRIGPDDLWGAVEAGIAVIGQTYRSLDPGGRERMRTAYEEATSAASTSGTLVLPSVALIASARRNP